VEPLDRRATPGEKSGAEVTDFDRVFETLLANEVEFIVIGGVAGVLHGAARNTFDIDVVYARNRGNLDRIVAAIAPFQPYLRGAPPGLPFLWDSQTLRRGLNFTLTTTIGDLELLGEIPGGGGYEALLPHSEEQRAFGGSLRVLGLAKLIVTKRAAGRPKDFEAIAELELLAARLEEDE